MSANAQGSVTSIDFDITPKHQRNEHHQILEQMRPLGIPRVGQHGQYPEQPPSTSLRSATQATDSTRKG